MPIDINSRITLNNGLAIPVMGFGTFRVLPGKECYQSVRTALDCGYRLIDTASMYENEADVGRAIRDAKIPRNQIFVTTKVWNSDQGYDNTIKAFETSLKFLNLDYIDLYLIHWPVESARNETWKAMEFLLTKKHLKSIGVSNYQIRHLEEMRSYAVILPAINQVEFTPFLYQKKLLQFCRNEDIQLQAYSPIARGQKLNNPVLLSIARKYEKTPAQIMIRYAIQHHVIPLPKSVLRNRIQQNIDIFDFEMSLPEMDMLNKLHEDFHVSWNPDKAI